MDFGILYMPNKAASQAAMGLGCFVLIFCIIAPYIMCLLFVPLYIAVFLNSANYITNDSDLKYVLLPPLVPFVFAGLLCLPLYWAIPGIVNFVRDCIDIITLNTGDNFLFRKDIPDNDCYLYFIGVLGGSLGSLCCIIELISQPFDTTDNKYQYADSDITWQEIWIKREAGKCNYHYLLPNISINVYKSYIKDRIGIDKAKELFLKETNENSITKKEAMDFWNRIEWLFRNDETYHINSLSTHKLYKKQQSDTSIWESRWERKQAKKAAKQAKKKKTFFK